MKLTNKMEDTNENLLDHCYRINSGVGITAMNFTALDVEIVRTTMHNILYKLAPVQYPVEFARQTS
jgi:hypothetical protein